MNQQVKIGLLLLVSGLIISVPLSKLIVLGIEATKARAELDRAKTALITEARGLVRQGHLELAHGWRDVAKEYLSEYEQGKVDQYFTDVVRGYEHYPVPNGYGFDSYDIFAYKTAWDVRETFRKKMQEHSAYRITDEEASARLQENPKIRRLEALSEAALAVRTCASKAADSRTIEEVRKIETDFTNHKSTLIRILMSLS